jgi:broad specificity phosphatase PhoE
MPDDHTTVRLHDRTADDLHARKDRGESYDDVTQRLIDVVEHIEHAADPGEDVRQAVQRLLEEDVNQESNDPEARPA